MMIGQINVAQNLRANTEILFEIGFIESWIQILFHYTFL